MPDLSLADLSKKMSKLDFAMMVTHALEGGLTARPMSNNGDVEYQGDSYFFADGGSRKIVELRTDPHVTLTYTGAVGMLGGPPLFITIEGEAVLSVDKAVFAEHWTKELDVWFPGGIDTPGLTMIHVAAADIRYWDGGEEGTISV